MHRCGFAGTGCGRSRLNFSREDYQDQVFGREYAAAAGAIHREIPKQAGDLVPDYSKLMADVWTASQAGLERPAERANIVWSGEGGSVALGHVHLTEAIADMMRNGNTDGGSKSICGSNL